MITTDNFSNINTHIQIIQLSIFDRIIFAISISLTIFIGMKLLKREMRKNRDKFPLIIRYILRL
jgi:hypothetical protein